MTMSDRIAVMNHGRYEQLGDPEMLYERPATRFVAGFLGVSNLLPVERAGSAGDHDLFRLPDGATIKGRRGGDGSDAAAGRPIALGVRPEKIRLTYRHEPVANGANRLDGVVRSASYLGVSTQYVVELGDGRTVTVFEQNIERATKAELWAAGDEVALSWLPEHTFIVADGGDGSATEAAAGEPAEGH